MNPRIARIAALSISLVLSACTGTPKGTQPVAGFALERYLGQWYEIARFDHSFERGLDCVTADYTLRDDGGVRVINRGVNLETGEEDEAEGRAYFVRDESVAHLKVSFFGPFYGGYNVLVLDDEYRWALVSGPTRDYLWILARDPQLDPAVYRKLVEDAERMAFPVGELIEVEQGERCSTWR
ncbi:lipocalin family protein [Billgrantia montanilacus]|uniref:Outer membrane lipoprotein Blc n=1 Tax=Billgrantia montanilacus TaxID=2282305 RepID=A0A368U3X2_9GAMM|nr:lipocalin family protein [Halomonas montanilacus]RCV91521.1 lipocalin [Halomonas montanilacus]